MIHITLALYLATKSFAAFDYRENSPASLFPHNLAAVDATLPDAASNPAYLPAFEYPYLHCSGSKPFTLDELYSTILRIGYGTSGFGVQASWNRFGFEQYLENIAEIAFGYRPVKYISFGAGVSYYNISIHTLETSLSSHLCDGSISVVIAPFEWIDLAFRHENVVSIFIKKRKDLLYPAWSAGAALKPIHGLAFVWNINRTPYGYVNSISASVNILKYFIARAGYAKESMTYAASVSLIYKYVSVSYGLAFQPHLGFTHSFGVSIAPREIPVVSLNYGNIFQRIHEFRTIDKIDISVCARDELVSIPEMNEVFAERIIKYRENVGPVTKDALVQIGMKEQEIHHLLKYIKGVKTGTPEPKANSRFKRLNEKTQKEIFKKLLGEGLAASLSLELAEMAVRGQHLMIRDKLGSLREIDAEKKKKILKLCTEPF
jgi:hypothetical protein